MIRYSTQALEDLDNLEIYYTECAGRIAAETMVGKIVGTLERLIARNPRVGRLRPELRAEIRSFPVLPYVVFYQANGSRIYVVRILHGHRNIQRPLASLLMAM